LFVSHITRAVDSSEIIRASVAATMPTTRSKANVEPVSAITQQQEAGRKGGEVTTTTTHAGQPESDAETAFMPRNLKITNLSGNLTIDPPDNSIVIHAVNCLGEWGSGVALALAKALPGAYRVYKDLCKQHENAPDNLLGLAQLIPPQKGDFDLAPRSNGSSPRRRRWVWCLFVSEGYGRQTKTKPGKSKPADIIRHTRKALEDVRHMLFMGQTGQMPDWGSEEIDRDGHALQPILDVIWACKFNSGSFGVKWAITLTIIKDILEGRNGDIWHGEIRVISHDKIIREG
jgi:ADP-ribose 1''-phosphate phosphatase